MGEQDDQGELKKLIVRDMSLDAEEKIFAAENMERLKEKLTDAINILLQTDFQKLLNAMYRLDIDEKLFRDTLSDVHSPSIAGRLADLVINREMEKVKTRKKYGA